MVRVHRYVPGTITGVQKVNQKNARNKQPQDQPRIYAPEREGLISERDQFQKLFEDAHERLIVQEAQRAPISLPTAETEQCTCLQDERHVDCPAIKLGKCAYQNLYRSRVQKPNRKNARNNQPQYQTATIRCYKDGKLLWETTPW